MKTIRGAFPLAFALLLLSRAAPAAVGLLDHQGARLPLESLSFTDDDGHVAPLAAYFHPGRPVLLAPVFYGCRGVCTVTLTNLVSALKLVNPSPGRGFELLAVSIAPDEGPALAREKKGSYLKAYGRPETAAGWHFLTGSESEVRRLTAALGFQFERDPSGLLSHPSALYVLSPDGTISTTFPGTAFSHKELRAALFEAQEGRVEAFLQRASAFCYAYMPHPGFLSSPLRWLIAFACLLGVTIALASVAFGRRRDHLVGSP